ncbi:MULTISPECIES: hypothetical protein [Bacillus]|uniref:hypothetical protein n=1 Tax=Bacillus TaxID=1386 RepID=UPI0015D504A1|nr:MULTISPECIES: hypothetical protein [Bacillus]HDR7656212.1 hypothetical protein [Bacillus wiedmannii]
MNIERVFNTKNEIKMEDIINSIINDKIDKIIENHYAFNKVNSTTSTKKGSDVA